MISFTHEDISKMVEWKKEEYSRAFYEVKKVVQQYHEYDYSFINKSPSASYIDTESNLDAFNILLVISGNREACAFESTRFEALEFEYTTEVLQAINFEIKEATLKLGKQLQDTITALGCSNIKVIWHANKLWIYNISIQEEINTAIASQEACAMSQLLRPLVPKDEPSGATAVFKYDTHDFMEMDCNLTVDHLIQLKSKLYTYRRIAHMLNVMMSLHIIL